MPNNVDIIRTLAVFCGLTFKKVNITDRVLALSVCSLKDICPLKLGRNIVRQLQTVTNKLRHPLELTGHQQIALQGSDDSERDLCINPEA